MKDNKLISGIIKTTTDPVVFAVDSFRFKFMATSMEHRSYLLMPRDRFLFAKTHDNHNIAIFSNQSISFVKEAYLNTPLFVVSDSNILDGTLEKFDTISLTGGTLNLLFDNNALIEDYSEFEVSNKIALYIKDDSIKFSFTYDDIKCNVKIRSIVNRGGGLREPSLQNKDVEMTINFSEKQSISKFIFHLNKIKTIISIMTYRRNVSFDSIKLINTVNDILHTSTVYYRNDEETTRKAHQFCIGFLDFGDNLSNFFETIYNSNGKKSLFEFGFIPSNDKDARFISIPMVRSISTALECEYGFLNIKSPENKELNNLISNVKKVIKEHRDGKNALNKNTYDLIFSSIKHWSLPLTDKIWQMVELFKDKVQSLFDPDFEVSREDIKKFVEYRNGITHSGIRQIDQKTCDTANALAGLVYCCFLKRMGLEKEKIEDLIDDNFLSRT